MAMSPPIVSLSSLLDHEEALLFSFRGRAGRMLAQSFDPQPEGHQGTGAFYHPTSSGDSLRLPVLLGTTLTNSTRRPAAGLMTEPISPCSLLLGHGPAGANWAGVPPGLEEDGAPHCEVEQPDFRGNMGWFAASLAPSQATDRAFRFEASDRTDCKTSRGQHRAEKMTSPFALLN
eukprot:TRINITY_DN44415_c0_g1_i1.p1 TRINITY_DN44415_c0_g1~~TRINITY_DN44415_c0_g1_i1.p1  ORF type:complete len:198 (-),score=28.24 TRINITY_DN44415_c0_g1_i1:128-652(-)